MKMMKPHHNSGQSLVELALLLPAILLLAIVTLDLGRGIYYYSAIYNAAREGARYGIVMQQPYNSTPLYMTEIKEHAKALTIGLDSTKLYIPNPVIDGNMLQVTVEYEFVPITPIAIFGYEHIHMSSTSSMLIER